MPMPIHTPRSVRDAYAYTIYKVKATPEQGVEARKERLLVGDHHEEAPDVAVEAIEFLVWHPQEPKCASK